MRAKFINESKPFIAWHTSFEKIITFKSEPSWFTPKKIWAKSYHKNNNYEYGGDIHTYEVLISGNILSINEFKQLCKTLNIDHDRLIEDLVSNPSSSEKNNIIKPFIDKCDGFYQWDYNPIDPQKDAESILVINPAKHVKIVKELEVR